jgi:hypothetical protein
VFWPLAACGKRGRHGFSNPYSQKEGAKDETTEDVPIRECVRVRAHSDLGNSIGVSE